jgi:hypothetical protein
VRSVQYSRVLGGLFDKEYSSANRHLRTFTYVSYVLYPAGILIGILFQVAVLYPLGIVISILFQVAGLKPLVDGMPRSTDLPDDLKQLVFQNALQVGDAHFDDDCDSETEFIGKRVQFM